MMIFKKPKENRGESIIETVFYIAIFGMLSIVVINAMITMMKSYKEVSINRDLIQSGNMLETMSREIKKSYSINSIATSDLVLNSKDSSGNTRTAEFVLSGNDLQFKENSTFVSNLNSSNIVVSGISFTQITTAKGSAIKIGMSVAPKSKTADVENFYDTVVLRGSY